MSASNVVLMGEKITNVYDYYMEYGDFDRVVEKYRHGIQWGSNYLMLDMHVDTILPNVAEQALDPWDFAAGRNPPTTAPGNGQPLGGLKVITNINPSTPARRPAPACSPGAGRSSPSSAWPESSGSWSGIGMGPRRRNPR